MNHAVVLAAHGSRDPRAAATVRALARAVAARMPGREVRAAFLELSRPHLADVLGGLGDRPTVVVPLLLTPAYHARTDLPGVVAVAREAGARVDVAPVLGPDTGHGVRVGPIGPDAGHAVRAGSAGPDGGGVPAELVAALLGRLRPAGADALVLAAAGSRDPAALAGVETVAAALRAATGLPCRPGYVTGIGEPVGAAAGTLRAAGARTVAVASYFLAPGLLYDRAVAAATESAVRTVAPPLGAHRDLVGLVCRRVGEAAPTPRDRRAALAPAA